MSKAGVKIPDSKALRGERYLTSNEQFKLVYEKGRSWAGRELVLKTTPNGLDSSRYGLTVSKHVGKAVVRNKIKRRLREILRKEPLKPGWDIIFIARAPAASADFTALGNTVRNLLVRAGLITGRNEGISSGAN